MLSAILMVLWLATNFALVTVAIHYGARAAGSERGTLRFAALGTGLFLAISLLGLGLTGLMPTPTNPLAQLAILGLVFTAQVWLTFKCLQFLFKLSKAQTFLPFLSLFAASIVIFAVSSRVIQPYVAEALIFPTHSMAPTLHPGDRFLVSRLRPPKRWSVIAYWHEDRFQRARYGKRLVGLPGERIRFEAGNLYVNDQLVAAPPPLAGKLTAELPREFRVLALYRDGQTITLGRDEMFVLGDDLARSADSRVDGPEKMSSIIGVVDFVYWPPNHVGPVE